MNWRNLAVVTGLAVLLYGSFRALGWWGFSLVSSGIVFWLLQLTTRLMQTMERAADQPVGSVAMQSCFTPSCAMACACSRSLDWLPA